MCVCVREHDACRWRTSCCTGLSLSSSRPGWTVTMAAEQPCLSSPNCWCKTTVNLPPLLLLLLLQRIVEGCGG